LVANRQAQLALPKRQRRQLHG